MPCLSAHDSRMSKRTLNTWPCDSSRMSGFVTIWMRIEFSRETSRHRAFSTQKSSSSSYRIEANGIDVVEQLRKYVNDKIPSDVILAQQIHCPFECGQHWFSRCFMIDTLREEMIEGLI